MGWPNPKPIDSIIRSICLQLSDVCVLTYTSTIPFSLLPFSLLKGYRFDELCYIFQNMAGVCVCANAQKGGGLLILLSSVFYLITFFHLCTTLYYLVLWYCSIR